MRRVGVILLATLMGLSIPVTADVRSDIHKVQRTCEDGYKKVAKTLRDLDGRELARTLRSIDDRLKRLERLMTRRR